MTAPLPPNEVSRLAALTSYGILDSEPEEDFDDLVKLAAYICGTPMALVSLVDGQRQWFKAHAGIAVNETPREHSFCAHAILKPDEVMEVEDATKDPRFSDNPLVTGAPDIRFYAGAPLVSPDGYALGSLCVIDRAPNKLTPEQSEMLEILSKQVVAQMQLRAKVQELRDISAYSQNVARELKASEERFQLFMDHTPMLAMLRDEEGRYVFVNETFLKKLKVNRDDVLGKTDLELWPQIGTTPREQDLKVLAEQKALQIEQTMPSLTGEGEESWLVCKFPLKDRGGKSLIGVSAVEITDRKFYERQMQEYQSRLEMAVSQLEEMALTDSLTGLRNKASFEARIDEEIGRARRYHLPLSLLMIDIDHFKSINDVFGHPVGDEVLARTAGLLREAARPSDFVARYGGEEFAMVLTNTDARGAYNLAERLRESVEQGPAEPRQLTISVGAASLAPGESVRSLLIRADKALYDAKNAGRNRVCTAEFETHEMPFSFDEL